MFPNIRAEANTLQTELAFADPYMVNQSDNCQVSPLPGYSSLPSNSFQSQTPPMLGLQAAFPQQAANTYQSVPSDQRKNQNIHTTTTNLRVFRTDDSSCTTAQRSARIQDDIKGSRFYHDARKSDRLSWTCPIRHEEQAR